jgi:carbonic anhydrase
VGTWLNLLRPGFDRVANLPEAERTRALEREAVVISLENLMTFPFVTAALEAGDMTLHGLWTDIGAGGLEQYEPASGQFVPL